jgi:hypothetical protein
MGPEVPIAEEHHQGTGQHREGDQDQDAGDQHVPGEDRHPEHGHARGTQVEDGADQVDAGEDGRETGEDQGHDPDVTAQAWRVRGARERGVGHPAEGGGSAGHEEAEQHRDRPGQVQPVGEGVQPGEGHVGSADLERHDVVRKPTEGERTGEQVEHQAPVHGEQLVVLVERDQRRVGRGELEPDHERHDPGQVEEHDRSDHVADTDDLVVGAGQPLQDPGGTVLFVIVVDRGHHDVGSGRSGTGQRRVDDVGHVITLRVLAL